MRAFGWLMAITIAVNIVASFISVLAGWDFTSVQAVAYAGVMAWFVLEHFE